MENNDRYHTGQHNTSSCDVCLIHWLETTTPEQRAAEREAIIVQLVAQDRIIEDRIAARYER
jgi:hypothetical protein